MRKQQTYKEMLFKFTSLHLKREDNFERYISNEKAHEYVRQKKLDTILEKIKKIEETK